MDWIKNVAKNFLALFIGCILAFVILEIFLSVYNPFEFRLKGDKIVLPANTEYLIKNNKIKGLDKTIIHRKNSLGFRGEEPPGDFEKHLTIITIGASTTEGFSLSEGKTWPDILGNNLKNVFKSLWINNAGLSGHSTFGHRVLMENYVIRLKPKVVLFLVGAADVERKDLTKGDRRIIADRLNFHSAKGFLISTANYSEVFAVALNIYRYVKARNKRLVHREINVKELKSIEIPEETKRNIIQQRHKKKKYLKPYETRLNDLIQISRENGIEPILITQPALYGNAIDDITNTNLAKLKIVEKGLGVIGENINGELAWQILELYNDVTRQVGLNKNVLVVDLASEMPKSTRYFWDWFHYTNEGVEKVEEIIYKKLCPFLTKRYNEYLTKDCNILTKANKGENQ